MQVCKKQSETIKPITGGCSLLATMYKYKQFTNNNIAKEVHYILAYKYDIIEQIDPYYKYEPKKALENRKAKLY